MLIESALRQVSARHVLQSIAISWALTGCGGQANLAPSPSDDASTADAAVDAADDPDAPDDSDAGPTSHLSWLTPVPGELFESVNAVADPPTGLAASVAFLTSRQIGVLDNAGHISVTWTLDLTYTSPAAAAPDSAGGVMVVGRIEGDSPSCGPPTLAPLCACGIEPSTPCPCPDAFLARVDYEGNLAWCARRAGDDAQAAYAVTVDDAGNAYAAGVTGIHWGGLDQSSPPEGEDLFVVAYSLTGDLLWERTFPDPAMATDVLAMRIDPAGELMIAVTALGVADYGLGAMGGEGTTAIRLLRLDTNGTPRSVVQLAEAEALSGCRASFDCAGGVSLVGGGMGTIEAGALSAPLGLDSSFALGAGADGSVEWLLPITFDPDAYPALDVARGANGDTLFVAAHMVVMRLAEKESTAPSQREAIFVAKVLNDGALAWSEAWSGAVGVTLTWVGVRASGGSFYLGSGYGWDLDLPGYGVVPFGDGAAGFVARIVP